MRHMQLTLVLHRVTVLEVSFNFKFDSTDVEGRNCLIILLGFKLQLILQDRTEFDKCDNLVIANELLLRT
jgi:hypothetical protein